MFNITQFFSSLNHQLIPFILNKVGLNLKVLKFFFNYLIGRKTQYIWNNFSSLFFEVNISIEQGSALSSILLVLYLSPLFHIFEKCAKNLKIPVSPLSFVDNSLFVSQENLLLFYSYNIIFSLLDQFGLVIKYRKTKVFYFSRSHDCYGTLEY